MVVPSRSGGSSSSSSASSGPAHPSPFNPPSECRSSVDLVHVLFVTPSLDGTLDVVEAVVTGKINADGRLEPDFTASLPDCLTAESLIRFPWQGSSAAAFAAPLPIRGALPDELKPFLTGEAATGGRRSAASLKAGSRGAVAGDQGVLRNRRMLAVHYRAYGADRDRMRFPHLSKEELDDQHRRFNWSLSVFQLPVAGIKGVYASFKAAPGLRLENGRVCALPRTRESLREDHDACAPLKPLENGRFAAGLVTDETKGEVASIGGVLVASASWVELPQLVPEADSYQLMHLDTLRLDVHVGQDGIAQLVWNLENTRPETELWPALPREARPCSEAAANALRGGPSFPELDKDFGLIAGCLDPRQAFSAEVKTAIPLGSILDSTRSYRCLDIWLPTIMEGLAFRRLELKMRIDGATDLTGVTSLQLACSAAGPELTCTWEAGRCLFGEHCRAQQPTLSVDIPVARLGGWNVYQRHKAEEEALKARLQHERKVLWTSVAGVGLFIGLGGFFGLWMRARARKRRLEAPVAGTTVAPSDSVTKVVAGTTVAPSDGVTKVVAGTTVAPSDGVTPLIAQATSMQSARTLAILEQWGGDGRLNQAELLELHRQVAERFNVAWCSGRMEPMRSLLSGGIYNRSRVQLDLLRREGITEEMLDWQLHAARVVGLTEEGPWQVAHVAMVAAARNVEHSRDDSTDAAAMERRRRHTPVEAYLEVWSFVRKGSAAGIEHRHVWQGGCPRCGSGVDRPGEYNRCQACETIFSSGEHDWVLAEITQADEWKEVTAAASPHAPHQYLEDRGSLIFWKWAEAMVLERPGPLRRLATDRCLEQLEHTSSTILQTLKTDVGLHADRKRGWKEVSRFIIGGVDAVSYSSEPAAARVVIKLNAIIADRWWWAALELSLVRATSEESPYGFGDVGCDACGAPLPEVDADACDRCGAALQEKVQDWLLDGIRLIEHQAQ